MEPNETEKKEEGVQVEAPVETPVEAPVEEVKVEEVAPEA